MEQIKYYLDEHIHSAVAMGLRRRGVDVLTVQEAARAGFADDEQLSFALTDERAMDSDYLVLAAGGVPNAGIAYANRKRTVGELIAALMLLRDVLTPEEMVNHV